MDRLLSLICKLLHCFILGTAPVVGDEVEVGTVGGGWTEQVSTVTEGAIWCPGLSTSGGLQVSSGGGNVVAPSMLLPHRL